MKNEVKDARDFGFFMVENELIESCKFDVYEIAIYVALCRYGNNKDRLAFPSLNKLADNIRSSKPTVIKYLKQLQSKGLIEIKKVKSDKNKYEKNTYIIKGVVKEVNKGSKRDLPPLVKKVNHPSKAALPKEEQIKNNKVKKKTYIKDFEELWEMYPLKKGKGRIVDKKTKLEHISNMKQEMKRCIERYIKYVEMRKSTDFPDMHYMNGSTFFNSGYVDYTDDNYKPIESKPKQRRDKNGNYLDEYGNIDKSKGVRIPGLIEE